MKQGQSETTTGSERGRQRERGAGLVEYVLLLSLIALACVGALTFFGGETGGSMADSGSCLLAADGSDPAPECRP
jgi:Flp pilus assembly pilin Flp